MSIENGLFKVSYSGPFGKEGRKKIINSNGYAKASYDPNKTRREMSASVNRDGSYRTSSTGITNNAIGMTYSNISDKELISICMEVYERVGIVRNIIDLMSDFATEGVDIFHTSEKINNFWSSWKKKAKILNVTNKIALSLLKSGIFVVKRRTAVLGKKEEKDMRTASGKAFKEEGKKSRTIPIGYVLIDPRKLKITGTNDDGSLKVEYKNKRIDRDPNYFIATYKRDDWSTRLNPFHSAALDDLAFENKMQRMDVAVMDGAINNIRLWKLGGQLKDGTPIFPEPAAVTKLANIIENDTGGGTADIIWDQFLDLKTEYPPVKDILGSNKYEYIRHKILEDFGIAQVLIDGTGQGSYSNQYLSVTSLIEKLEYIRGLVEEWLTGEINFIKKNLNMKKSPNLRFKHIDLSDKNAERAIVLQFVDRGLISKEQALQYLDENWSVERERIKNEKEEENRDDQIKKKGPFDLDTTTDNPTTDEPKQIGNPGGDGRPPNQPGDKTQKVKRKTKPLGASFHLIELIESAKEIQEAIDKFVDPIFFSSYGVNNIKQLKKEARKELNGLKFFMFCNAKSKKEIGDELIKRLESTAPEKLDRCVKRVYNRLVSDYRKKNGKSPNAEKRKELQSSSWGICKKSTGL